MRIFTIGVEPVTRGRALWRANEGALKPWEVGKFSAIRRPFSRFGLSLTRDAGLLNQESYPWQWLVNEVQMTYLRTDQQVLVNDQVVASYATVFFRGAMNPFVIGAAPLGAAYAAWRAFRCRDILGLWVVAWIAATYLPFFPLSILQHRIMYIFYFLPTLPAVAVAIALFVRESGLPRTVQFGYIGAVLLGFISYFPFRSIP